MMISFGEKVRINHAIKSHKNDPAPKNMLFRAKIDLY